MPDSMVVCKWKQNHPSDSVGDHAEWLVCADIQRSQRGRSPFAQPCIPPPHTLTHSGALSVCVAAPALCKVLMGRLVPLTVTERSPLHTELRGWTVYSVCLETG